jgi:Flp pilus assembly protein CpaB
MDANRLAGLCTLALAFGAVLNCSAVQPPQTRPISIPPGMRAVSMRSKVASSTQAGSHVDVVLTREGDAQSTVLLQDVGVAASHDGVVTILTSPKDAEKLTIACEQGRIDLVLHRPNLYGPNR